LHQKRATATGGSFDSATSCLWQDSEATIGNRHVVSNGTDEGNNCTDKTVPCKTVSYALSQTANEDEIWIARGEYQDADLLINQAVSLRGGYSPDFSAQSIDPTNTIIDAQGLGRGLRIQNVPAIFEFDIEGLSFKNGQAPGAAGGGIYIQGSSSPNIKDILVEGCEAANGGGVYIDSNGGLPYLLDVIINNTKATGRGGGIYLNRGNLVLEHITVTNATASEGGAVYNLRSNSTLSATTLSDNEATRDGGAIYNAGGSFQLYNGYIFNNTATRDGGGLYSQNGTLTAYHNTLFNNQAGGTGGHIYQATGGLSVVNNIFVDGQATTTGGLHRITTSSTAHHNLYQNNLNGDSNQTLGAGSITGLDPSFINSAEGDFHLNLGSPAIDNGDADLRLPIANLRLGHADLRGQSKIANRQSKIQNRQSKIQNRQSNIQSPCWTWLAENRA